MRSDPRRALGVATVLALALIAAAATVAAAQVTPPPTTSGASESPSAKRRTASVQLAFEAGVVRWAALPGPLATGVGKVVIVGLRRGNHGAEVHASAGYRHEPPADVRSVRATGHSGYFAVMYRRTVYLPRFDVSVAGGLARLSAPLYFDATDNLGSEPGAGTMSGLGAMLAVGAAYPLLDGVDLTAEVRTGFAVWALPRARYVEQLEENGTSFTATYGTGEPTPVPLVMGVGLRVSL